jgi:hypothetical protein
MQTLMPPVGLEHHDPSFRAGDDGKCLRLRDHCDRLALNLEGENSVIRSLIISTVRYLF